MPVPLIFSPHRDIFVDQTPILDIFYPDNPTKYLGQTNRDLRISLILTFISMYFYLTALHPFRPNFSVVV